MMTPKQHKELIEQITKSIDFAVDSAVGKKVNSKMDEFRKEMNQKLEAQDLAMKPVIDAFSGGKGLWNALIGILKILGLVGMAGAGWVVISSFVSKK